MKKRAIITISIVSTILLLLVLLFTVVFAVRKQNVTISGNVRASKEEIVDAMGIKNGTPILFLNKEKAINNLEKSYPYLKVVQIKTTSVTTIEVIVKQRHAFIYSKIGEDYYLLDEDCKLLEITKNVSDIEECIEISSSQIGLTADNKICDFVGSQQSKDIIKNFFVAMYSNGIKIPGEIQYFQRETFTDYVKSVTIEDRYIKINDEFIKDKQITITTQTGVKFVVEQPNTDLTYKLGLCWASWEDEDIDNTQGLIHVFVNEQGEVGIQYFKTEPTS